MNTLHILTRLHDNRLPQALQRSLESSDALLLSGDAVYAALSQPEALPADCHALVTDVEARGLRAQWPAGIALVDHGGYVDLCVQYTRSLSWS
jgi:sulfur relay protein TusB/DsrH